MTIGPIDILEYASSLDSTRGNCETVSRSIVGRAYYSVFHFASQLACSDLAIDLDAIKASAHARLFTGLKDFSTADPVLKTKLQALSRDLKALHSVRVHADYHLHRTLTAKQASLSVVEARRLCQRIVELQTLIAA